MSDTMIIVKDVLSYYDVEVTGNKAVDMDKARELVREYYIAEDLFSIIYVNDGDARCKLLNDAWIINLFSMCERLDLLVEFSNVIDDANVTIDRMNALQG